MTEKAYLQHLTRGGELLRSDRVHDAKSELEKALALKPGDGKILNLLGLACFRLEDYGRALEIYRDLVAKQPYDSSLRLNLGLVFLKTCQVEQAIGGARPGADHGSQAAAHDRLPRPRLRAQG